MLYLDLFIVLLAIAVVLFFVTQVLVPFVRGTPYFPNLRKTAAHEAVVEAEHTLEELSEVERLKALTEQITQRSNKLKD
jgi:hypothetical protein